MDGKMDVLLDSYCEKGSGEKAFFDVLEGFAARTQNIRLQTKDLVLLSLCRMPKLQRPGYACFFILSESSIASFLECGDRMKITYIPEGNIGEAMLEEIRETTGMMAQVNGRLYMIGEDSFLTLCLRANVGGHGMKDDSNLIRDLHLAKKLFDNKRGVSIVARSDSGGTAGKFFCFYKHSYLLPPTPMILETLKDPRVRNTLSAFTGQEEYDIVSFRVSNREMECLIRLGDSSTVSPGLMLCDSDTGHGSLTARQVWITPEGHYVIAEETCLEHSNHQTEEKYAGVISLLAAGVRHQNFRRCYDNLIGRKVKGDVKTYDYVRQVFSDDCPVAKTKEFINFLEESYGIGETASAWQLPIAVISNLSVLDLDKARIANIRKSCYRMVMSANKLALELAA